LAHSTIRSSSATRHANVSSCSGKGVRSGNSVAMGRTAPGTACAGAPVRDGRAARRPPRAFPPRACPSPRQMRPLCSGRGPERGRTPPTAPSRRDLCGCGGWYEAGTIVMLRVGAGPRG
jgi:hypothetical protein